MSARGERAELGGLMRGGRPLAGGCPATGDPPEHTLGPYRRCPKGKSSPLGKRRREGHIARGRSYYARVRRWHRVTSPEGTARQTQRGPAVKAAGNRKRPTHLRSASPRRPRRPAPGTAPRYRRHGLTGTPGQRHESGLDPVASAGCNQSHPPADLRRVGAGVRFVIMLGFRGAASGAAVV